MQYCHGNSCVQMLISLETKSIPHHIPKYLKHVGAIMCALEKVEIIDKKNN